MVSIGIGAIVSPALRGSHGVHISVYEKGTLGYIYIPGINEKNAYFDKDGFVVETSSDTCRVCHA